MKSVFTLLGLLVLIGSIAGCGRAGQFADEAVVIGAGLADNLDEAAAAGAGLADNLDEAAAVGANLGNDAARVSPAVIDDLVRNTTYQRIVDLTGVTPDQQAVIENAIISTACEMLLTSLEGGELKPNELAFQVGSMISGIFIDEAEGIDWILESADFLRGTLLESGYDQGSLTEYCGYLP